MEIIKSTSNAKVKRLVNLKKKRKLRDEEKVFLVEGIRMVEEIPQEKIQELYLSESFYKANPSWSEQGRKGRLTVFSDTVFSYISDTKTPQGVLAVVKQASYKLWGQGDGSLGTIGEPQGNRQGDGSLGTTQAQPCFIVLDNLQDPGNLGTIFRSAEGAGVSAIILSKDCVDIYNPKTVRATMGAIFRVPFVYVEDLVGTIEKLKKNGVKIYAAHLKGKAAYDQMNYKEACAFLIGNEGNGLRDEVAETADTYVLIPMQGQVESLNAAIAMTILAFEMARQRR